jgi:ATP-dependent DNA helicase RecG
MRRSIPGKRVSTPPSWESSELFGGRCRRISALRTAGGDTASVEVKSAAGGLPTSITPTLSAMANLPGGGVIILGLDERTGFRPVPLTNAQALKQGLAAKARTYTPPVRLAIADGVVDGEPVVVATVHECDRSAKPCRVSSAGKAYLHIHDGNYELSDLEEQAFLAQREPPHFDRRTVEGATAEDLDPELLEAWTAAARERNPRGLGRFGDDTELLRRGGVLGADGHPTVARSPRDR